MDFSDGKKQIFQILLRRKIISTYLIDHKSWRKQATSLQFRSFCSQGIW